ncbi:MAG: hypothetical protein O9322_09310 [Beijerinckiaceae bacterium]|nr:hypothetical protein [Beijerinckiaceae bacterium]MCZ8299531.1 hypothetical protein [Beijerinckiaceae bacterium]
MSRNPTSRSTLSRRLVLAGATAAATFPAMAASPAAPATPIARLWAEAESLRLGLLRHRGAIADAAASGGIPGWMRLGGEANRIAEARYGKLVAILNSRAEARGDLAILARVAQDDDILAGPRAWASERLAAASATLAA